MIFSVDANIGGGKTTILQDLKKYFKHESNYVFIDEPVNMWNNIKDKNDKTILSHFYENPEKWAFSFQMMAYISRISDLKKAVRKNPQATIVCERCVFSDKNVFAKMLYDAGKISEIDYSIYLKWFDEFLRDIPITGYIYLKTSPDTCLNRVKKRNREGENIPLSYLHKCHMYHENWLEKENNILVLDGNRDNIPAVKNEWIQKITDFINKSTEQSMENKWNDFIQPGFPIR